MAINVTNSNSARTGLCPHGLPPGACPICSGGGGGINDRNTRRNPSEMTYNECLAVWQLMKAAKARKNLLAAEQKNQILHKNQLKNNTSFLSSSINSIKNFFRNLPFMKSITTLANNGATKFINTLNNIFPFNKIQNSIKNVIIDISDKLTAIFGEEKLIKLKNLKILSDSAKEKILSLFSFINNSKKGQKDKSEQLKKDEKKISLLTKIRKKLKFITKDGKTINDN